MKTIKNVSSILCLAGCVLFGANCSNTDTDADTDEEGTIAEDKAEYAKYNTLTAADHSFLTELNTYFATHGNGNNYPMCVYAEAGAAAISNPAGVVNRMNADVSTWLSYLYGRWGWDVYSVTFSLKSTTEAGCAATYNGIKPFRVTSWTGGPAAGLAKAIEIRWPKTTADSYASGAQTQAALHEIGHVLGLQHTTGQAPPSVMDYNDFYGMSGLGGDDIIGVTNMWKLLSGQVAGTACEFGYAAGTVSGASACEVSGGSVTGREIRNYSTHECIQSPGTGEGATFVKATCDKTPRQKFDMTRNANGTWRIYSAYANKCMRLLGAGDGQVLTQALCNPLNLDQDFSIVKNETGSYKVISEYSHKELQVNGAALNQWKPLGKDTQSWYINLQ